MWLSLQVKYRIAAGLSKEGWAITRNLLTLLIMNGICILFFNYKMKEFAIIALVGLLCDAFLQLVLFLTALSIDLKRLEVCGCGLVDVWVWFGWCVSVEICLNVLRWCVCDFMCVGVSVYGWMFV